MVKLQVISRWNLIDKQKQMGNAYTLTLVLFKPHEFAANPYNFNSIDYLGY